MQTITMVAGVVVVLATLQDAVATTLSTTTRAGPLTRVTTVLAWRVALTVHRRRPVHRLLAAMGPGLLVTGLAQWLLGLWIGWALILGSRADAVVHATGQEPVGLVDRFYFAGASLFSLGTGDVVGDSPGWRVTSVVATATGLFVLTLSLSYFASVVAAATDRRVLAVRLAALGRTPQDMVLTFWQGDRLSPQLGTVLTELAQPVIRLAEQHVTYHVLHYFHAHQPQNAVVVGLARLDEALSILECGLVPEQRPDALVTRSLRSHLGWVVDVVGDVHQTLPAETPPPVPGLSALRRAGVPLVDGRRFSELIADLGDRRRHVAALVTSDGWTWEQVSGDAPSAQDRG